MGPVVLSMLKTGLSQLSELEKSLSDRLLPEGIRTPRASVTSLRLRQKGRSCDHIVSCHSCSLPILSDLSW